MRNRLIPLLAVAVLLMTGISQARADPTADVRRQISVLKDQISTLKGQTAANIVLLASDAVAILALKGKVDDPSVAESDKPRVALAIAQLSFAALQANESNLEADLKAKQDRLAYLQSLPQSPP